METSQPLVVCVMLDCQKCMNEVYYFVLFATTVESTCLPDYV